MVINKNHPIHYKIDESKNAVIIKIFFEPNEIDQLYSIIKKYPVLLFERIDHIEEGWRSANPMFSYSYGGCYGFNGNIVLTKNLKKVSFSSIFNTIFNTSKYLTCLLFGALFDKPINLNKQLKILDFRQEFNRPIVLTKYLKHLSLGTKYNCQLVVSKRLSRLNLGKHFNQFFILPKYLVHMSVGEFFDKTIYFEYPLGTFSIGHEQPRPKSCVKANVYYSPIIDNLPNVRVGGKIILRETFDAPLDNMPNYTSISVQNYNKKIRHRLPECYKEKCFKPHVWGQK